jgi:thiamine pyrophosphate-dependent acetolactate synthase large subunit-like protein
VTAAGDSPLNFYLWGAMGGAVPLGLGLALAQPSRRVLVITGDGEMLMGLGSLATVAIQAPPNLAIVVLDNERYGETGMQLTHTAGSMDLAAAAAASGIPVCSKLTDQKSLTAALPQIRQGIGPVFFNIKVRAEKLPLVLPPKDGAYLKDRFRLALQGAATNA